MSQPQSHFTLNNGTKIPAVGLGTWQAAPGEVHTAVKDALEAGYRHLDCALIYQNESEVGEGIKDSGVKREDIFITSKVWNTDQPDVKAGLEKTLKALGTDYLDLYLIHWPVRLVPNDSHPLLPVNPDGSRSVDRSWDQSKTWAQMEEVYKSGKVKAIGLSNWSIPYLEELKKKWTVVPAVNQVELHAWNPQHKLKAWCDKEGILLEAYCPLGSTGAPLLTDPELIEIAKKNDTTVATLLISYQVNRGCIVLPKSVTKQRIIDNQKVIPLSAEDIQAIDAMAANGKQRRVNTPKWGWDLGFEDWYGPVKA